MELINEILTLLADSAWRIIAVIIALIVGRWSVNWVRKRMRRRLEEQHAQPSLIRLSQTIAPYIVWFAVVFLVLILLGVPINSLLVLAAIILLAIGIAMQESIGNFSATIHFWLFRPFETGHVIQTGDTLGTVDEVELFSTSILAFDNKVHVLPNSLILENGLVNYSRKESLRVDLLFTIGDDDDVVKAKEVLAAVMAADDRVFKDPPPRIFVKSLVDDNVEIAAQSHVPPQDYWGFQDDIVEQAKHHLEENGFTSSNTQYDINLYQGEKPAEDA